MTDELPRLRAEVYALQARLDRRERRAATVRMVRRIGAAVLVAVTAFALVMSVVGIWSARTALDTDRWVATVAPLPKDPEVAAAVADFATVKLFEAVDVEQRLRAVLPEQAAFVAGPLANQLHAPVRATATEVLGSDQFQRAWTELNRRAHQRALAVVEGDSDLVAVHQDRVEIDLLPLINEMLRALSAQLPTLFGRQLSLPDLGSGEIPADLRERVQDSLGVTVPENFAQFTVYDSGQLWAAQQAVVTAERSLVLFLLGTFVLLVLALLVSPDRRRTALQLGLWLVVAAVAVTAALRAVREQVLLNVPEGLYRDGAADVLTAVFSQLRTRGWQMLWTGALLAALMYVIGPGRGPVWLRRRTVQAWGAIRLGGQALAAHGPGWTARHLDAVRVGGVAVAVLLALLLSSWTALLSIVVVLAAYELLVTVFALRSTRTG
ncbi:hypothetical protein [Lentzea flaviverrucosa]|uniref:Integral membrane protein n=1 Tax=Lentzea flaviverrucosa TaxID=200379 RepID=A0A1H9HPK6_9PSEU|nr:hypothetical protein [Lentzea flaviverrucosa]RDI34517.1 hypothetical protein DFR72_101265 [Lentzea flaviverrucosa]SEQ64243.1 hypothetical protein SAMN05216195_102952 [Lentzea flaviverrucosa]